ncbi:hypothetical protein [Streptomyces sp. ID05-47C]|uniref:hypothetical protein n=1 Tax=Streptomyces sp. ID05-47C TaxID=3028665 RepID=UPI0029A0024D|nr:hypothetical protein [Streptomyces sp. ID05-47C]MDX3572884.1 hypothetical protein [Streptomyces sp. ID05-47C]
MDPQISVALIGAAGVAGTVGGTVLGAWIQARGGRAQAQAARDAAVTAAQATLAHATQERVWTVIPVYLRAAGEYAQAVERLYQVDAVDDVLVARRAFELAKAEAELAAPQGMRSALESLAGALRALEGVAGLVGAGERAHGALMILCDSDVNAHEARIELRNLDVANVPTWTPTRLPAPAAYEPAVAALEAVAGLTEEQRVALLSRAPRVRAIQARRRDSMAQYQSARAEVVDTTRAALGAG